MVKYGLIFSIMLLPFISSNMATCVSEKTSNESIKKKKTKMDKEIYFAGGCFWGTEHFLKQIRGVKATEVGYANGNIEHPTYKQVCTGETGFAETVKVKYDAREVELKTLIELYFMTIDPTSRNKQGNDIGSQYRTGIYYVDIEDRSVIQSLLEQLSLKYSNPIVVEVSSLKNFYLAETYHQDYLDKNPNGYCHINPQLFDYARKANRKTSEKKYQKADKDLLKKELTEMQYAVTQNNETEPPFMNKYWDEFRPGIYVDVTTGEPLFLSTQKFKSNCGWPSFSKPITKELIEEKLDKTHGMKRIEVRSKTGDAHLGHVFNDGPKDKGGLRYCINSASLRFIPKEEMKKEGYADYLPLLEKE